MYLHMMYLIVCPEILPIPPKKVNTVVVEFYSEVEKDRYKEMTRNSMEAFKVCNYQILDNFHVRCVSLQPITNSHLGTELQDEEGRK